MFSSRAVWGLETAKPADLDAIEIGLSGFGLHFPKLDADIYLSIYTCRHCQRLAMVTGLVTAITQWPLAELPPIVKG